MSCLVVVHEQDETAPMLDDLYSLWFAHLWDNIPSVREDTAIALGNVIRSYGQEALDRILPTVIQARVSIPLLHLMPQFFCFHDRLLLFSPPAESPPLFDCVAGRDAPDGQGATR